MRIEVLEVGPVSKVKTFFQFNLKYKSDGKTQEKKMFSFNEVSYKALKDAQPNSFYEITLKKDSNGYWQWDSVEESTASAPVVASGGGGRGFETPEERARRQVFIIRQSCLAQSIATGVVGVSLDDILARAAEYEQWVNRE